MFGAITLSINTYISRVLECMEFEKIGELQCVANANYMTIDLMTPGLYAKKGSLAFREMFRSSCSAASGTLDIVMYPLSDFVFWKALHISVNLFQHVLIGIPIITSARCSIANSDVGVENIYSDFERKMMCSIDLQTMFTMMNVGLKAWGEFGDNWLNILPVVFGFVDTCSSSTDVATSIVASNDFLDATKARNVVSLTKGLYAITDGLSVMYNSANQESKIWSVYGWPFEINPDFGVAAVQTLSEDDIDFFGDRRTGLLGCSCSDGSVGMEISCASIPFQEEVAESEELYRHATIHTINFEVSTSLQGLSCDTSLISVETLRFSRKRFSVGNKMRDWEYTDNSRFDVLEQSGVKHTQTLSADAAIYVRPLCSGNLNSETSFACMKEVGNCFPFCMGLHTSGKGAQNIIMRNAARWGEYVDISHADCAVSLDEGGSCDSDSLGNTIGDASKDGVEVVTFSETFQSDCTFSIQKCASDDSVHSLVHVSQYDRPFATQNITREGGTVRLKHEPFVIAGDVILTVDDDNNVIVSRLYDNNRGDFTIRDEELSLVSNKRITYNTTCLDQNGYDDNACYMQAVLNNQIILPSLYTMSLNRRIAVSSEWAVHWVSHGDAAVWAAEFNTCQGGAATFTVLTRASYRRARIWTMKTMRTRDVEGGERHTAYMRVPNWLEQGSPCDGIVNQRVQDLEFFDENNILVSVLAAAPRDYDWFNGVVLPGREFTYRRYWLNPNRHDCIDDESDEKIYTCWRHESEGRWIPENFESSGNSPQVLLYGLQCPAMQKMPNVFGYLSAFVRMIVNGFHIVYDVIMLVTSAFLGGFGNIFTLRPTHITHHSILDTSGRRLLNVEMVIENLDEAKMHFSNSFLKVANLLAVAPGYDKAEVTVVGISRMLFEAHSPSTFYTDFIKKIPTMTMFKSIGDIMKSTPFGSMPPFVTGIQRLVYLLTNNIKFNLRWIRRLVIKLLRLSISSTLAEVVSILPTTIYESGNDLEKSITNPIKQFCVGVSQVFGYDNPLAQTVYHSCQTVPDLTSAIFGLVKILLTEYPNLACVCKLPRSHTVTETINDVCLRRFTPIDLRLWLLKIARYSDAQKSPESFSTEYCFQNMDYVNNKLSTLFDPFLSRLDKIASSTADCVDYLLIFFDVDAGNCDNFASSPYVVSLLPEPSSFFSACMHSNDCKIRCLETMNAFENALAGYSQIPAYEQKIDTYIDSMLFSANDVDEGRHLAPFVVYDLRELSDCSQICGPVAHKSNRCIVAAGVHNSIQRSVLSSEDQDAFSNMQNVRIAYYCLPADVTQSVYEYTDVTYNYTQTWTSDHVISDIFIVSESEIKQNRGEMLLVYARSVGSKGTGKVSFCRGDAYSYTITETMEFETNQNAIHEIKSVRSVVGSEIELFVTGTQVQETKFDFLTNTTIYTSHKVCEKFTIDVSSFPQNGDASIPSIHTTPCSAANVEDSNDYNVSVCLKQDTQPCILSVKLPMRGVGVEFHGAHGIKYYQSSNKLTQELGINPAVPLYITRDGQSVMNRRRVSRTTTKFVISDKNELDSLDVIIAGAFADRNSWIQILRLELDGSAMRSMIATSTQVETTVNMHVQCSISNCIGCQDSSGFTERLEDLQSKCYAAQQCAVSRCVGTTVNMRKPLCNVGSVMAKNLDLFRVGLSGLWQVVSEMIIVTVELSEQRREKYYITFPEQAFLGVVCNTKDTIVESSATFTSILGAVSHAGESAMARLDFDSTGSQVLDSRFHARFIMSTTSLTNLISSFLMAPIIGAVSAQQIVNCMSNDIMVTFKNIFNSEGNLEIEFGTQDVRESVENVVGICMSDVVADDMKKIGYNAGMDRAISSIHQIAFQIMDIQQYSIFSVFAHTLNGICSYAIGIVRSVMDLAQVIDWGKCKLPDVSSGFKADCVCGDKPVKAMRRQESSLWCSGPLLLTSIYGDDIVVWNPFTLHELIDRMGTSDVEGYFECLKTISSEDSSCTKPNLPEFEYQGVDAIQVITRCRENYQQKQWDSGALLLGVFEHDSWVSDTVARERINAGFARDSTILLKQRLKTLTRRYSTAAVSNLHYEDWSCLQHAYENKRETKACLQQHLLRLDMTADQYFEYEESDGGFLNTDSCWIFSGSVKQHNSLYNGSLSPAASSRIPVTEMHTLAQGKESRFKVAREKIASLQQEIGSTMSGHFDLPEDFTAEAYSQEGDEIHQFVDCMIMGPYASADLQVAFKMANGQDIPVVKYYRNEQTSRDFGNSQSSARSQIMKIILEHLELKVADIVRLKAQNRVNLIESQFFDESNLLCLCTPLATDLGTTPPPSLECCLQASSFADIQFNTQNLFENLENIKEDFISESLQEVIDSDIIKKIWTYDFENDHVLTLEQKLELADAYQFDFSSVVYEYSENDVNEYVFNVWKRCMQSLSASFFTMPLQASQLSQQEENYEMKIDLENINFDPTKQSGEEYLHGMEPIIEQVTQRMRQKSPFWWSHVHRYVPSHSVWCEDSERKQIDSILLNKVAAKLQTTSTTSDLFSDSENTHNINSEHINTLSYVSGYKSACVCGWLTTRGCDLYNLRNKLIFQTHAEIGVEWQTMKNNNPFLIYNDESTLFQMLKFIAYADNGDDPSIYGSCDGFNPSVAWGLLETDEYFEWYAGLSESDKQFSVGVHKLAATGPAGLRLAHLTQMNEHTKKYTHFTKRLIASINFEYGHTVAQPICAPDLEQVLTHDLRSHFKNVFFPMAHTVDESPTSAYCSRWAVEWALLSVLRDARGNSDQVTLLQEETEILWRRRCKTELDNLGICALRGVYELPPPDGYEVSCPFTLQNVNDNRASGSQVPECVYVTENCLVKCGTEFYDPCACGKCDDASARVCAAGLVFRVDRNPDWVTERIKLKSLHWPEQFPEKESGISEQTFLEFVQTDVSAFDNHHDDVLLKEIAELILSKDVGEGQPPDTSCDDLMDYFPADAQHPVGYHPTTSCLKSTTNMRGFDTWMSSANASDGREAWGIDPIRLRNMTAYTSEFGASHLVCDQSSYGAPSFSFNDLKISVHWSSIIPVDPAVPNPTQTEIDSGLFENVASAKSMFDTALSKDEFYEYDFFPHTTGLVRDWNKWHNPEMTDRSNEVDELWPHWNTARRDAYGIDDYETIESCALPPLRQCLSNDDCAQDQGMECKKTDSTSGICVKIGSCFRHEHCTQDNQLCSGDGTCVDADLHFYNKARKDVFIQTFSERCKYSTHGASEFENVPDFLTANGLCSHRNWYDYQNITSFSNSASGLGDVVEAKDRMISRSSMSEDALMTDIGLLKQFPHACDTTLLHSDYKTCTHDTSATSTNPTSTDNLYFLKTWSQGQTDDDMKSIYFCDFKSEVPVNGFLKPYQYQSENGVEDTLRYVPETIRRCVDFEICPQISFVVDSQRVEHRKIIPVMHSVLEETTHFNQILNIFHRKYLFQDAEQCWGVGYESSVSSETGGDTTICVVDRYTLPILNVLLQNEVDALDIVNFDIDENRLQRSWEYLTSSKRCPNAFRGVQDVFESTLRKLTRPYYESQREDITQRANLLLLQIFGIDESSNYRGFSTIAEYETLASCASHVLQKLNDFKDHVDSKHTVYAFENIILQEDEQQSDIANVNLNPGLSLYMFHERGQVFIPFMWLWKCVILSKHDEGGAAENWFERISSVDQSIPRNLECIIYDTARESIPDVITVKQFLQYSESVFLVSDKSSDAAVQIKDVELAVSATIQSLGLTSMPILDCIKNDIREEILCTRYDKSTCLTKTNSVMGLIDQSTTYQLDSYEIDSDTEYNLYTQVYTTLFGNAENQYVLSQQEMIKQGILIETNLNELISKDSEFVPFLKFASLQNMARGTYILNLDFGEASSAGVIKAVYNDGSTEQYATLADLDGNENCMWVLEQKEFQFFKGTQKYYLTPSDALFQVLVNLENFLYTIPSFTLGNIYKNTVVSALLQSTVNLYQDSTFNKPNTYSVYEWNMFMKTKKYECPANSDGLNVERRTNPHHHKIEQCYNALRTSVGVKIKRNERYTMSTTDCSVKDMLMAGFYPHAHENSNEVTFLKNLTSNSWIYNSHASLNDHICYTRDGYVEVINPFLATNYDIVSGCDVSTVDNQLIIDVGCVRRQGIDCNELFSEYVDEVKYKMPDTCSTNDQQLIFRRNTGSLRNGYTRFCDMKPSTEDVCVRKHGGLHGAQGMSVNSLYEQKAVTHKQTGMWKKTNSIFQTDRRARFTPDMIPALQMSESDIGGHKLDFEVQESQRNLDIWLTGIHLSETEHDYATMRASTAWLQTIDSHLAVEQAFYESKLASPTESLNWKCPLSWVTMYSGFTNRSLCARTPSAYRNEFRFSHITDQYKYTHPTVSSIKAINNLRSSKFMSEWMVCTSFNLDSCRGKSHLRDTIANSHKQILTVVQEATQESCSCVFDWPNSVYTLRDGSKTSLNQCEEYCNIFNRLPQFAVQLVRSEELASDVWQNMARSDTSTSNACRMGRLKKISKNQKLDELRIQFCKEETTNEKRALLCRILKKNDETELEKFLVDHVSFEYETAHTPTRVDVKHRSRQKCTACEDHQSHFFVRSNGEYVGINSSTPQLSVGMPIKVSTERLIAANLRSWLCSSATMDLASCMNSSVFSLVWEQNQFMSGLLNQAAEYSKNLSGGVIGQTSETYEEYLAREKLLWDRQWVFCGYSPLTGIDTCHGSISKEEWLDNTLREGSCKREVEEGSAQVDVKVPILFCLLDPKITKLCQQVADWNYEIKSILCKAAGICPQTGFFYNPSSYYLSNQEFVYDTVSEYYSSTSDVGAKCVKTHTDDQIELNDALKSKCASTKIAPLYDALVQVRRGLYLVVRALFYLVQLFVTLVQIVASAATGAITAVESLSSKLITYFRALLIVAADAFTTINQAMFELIFERGIGKQVMDFIYSVCESINVIYDLIVVQGVCVAIEWVAGILENIGMEIVNIAEVKINLQFTTIYPLSFLMGPGTAIVNAAETLASQSWCVPQDILTCKFQTDQQQSDVDGTLPVATRCFSTYTPFLGDTQQLSCTQADTCYMSALDQTRVVCGTCPNPELTTRSQFGCDLNTKICTCNTERPMRTPCLTNSECQTAHTCNYIDTNFELMTSTVPCRACMSAQFCFIQPSNDVGYCACGLVPTKNAQCEQDDVGRNVILPPSLCLLQQSDRTTQMSSSFVVHSGELMTASCMMADPSSSFCMLSRDLNDFFIVVTTLPRTFRRLLSSSSSFAADSTEPSMKTLEPLCRDALSSNHMLETKKYCEQKMLKSRMTVAMLQLKVPDCTFCSYEDLMQTSNLQFSDLWLKLNARKAVTIVLRHSTLGHLYENVIVFWRRVKMEIDNLKNSNLTNVLEITYGNNFFSVASKDTSRVTPITAHALEIAINLFPAKHKNVSKYHPTIVSSNGTQTVTLRKLLQDQDILDSVKSMIDLHSDYSQQISNSFQYKFTDLVNTLNTDWLLAPVKRAPDLEDVIECVVAFNLLKTFSDASQTTVLYYRYGFTSSPSPTLKWPTISAHSQTDENEVDAGEVSLARLIFEEFSTLIGFGERDVVDVVNATLQTATQSFKCDFEAIQTCSKWNHYLYHSFIVVFAYVSIILLIMVTVQFHMFSVFVGVIFFNMVLWYSYSYAWSCTPLIPVCILKDFVYSFQQIFPLYFEFPKNLLRSSDTCRQTFCLDTSETCTEKLTLDSDCYLSCSDIKFDNWESTVSFILAWFKLVDVFKKILPSIPLDLHVFEQELDNKASLLLSNEDGSNQDLVNANYICTFLNLYQLAPPILLLTFSLNTIILTLQSLSLLIFSFLNFVFSWVVSIFTH